MKKCFRCGSDKVRVNNRGVYCAKWGVRLDLVEKSVEGGQRVL